MFHLQNKSVAYSKTKLIYTNPTLLIIIRTFAETKKSVAYY